MSDDIWLGLGDQEATASRILPNIEDVTDLVEGHSFCSSGPFRSGRDNLVTHYYLFLLLGDQKMVEHSSPRSES